VRIKTGVTEISAETGGIKTEVTAGTEEGSENGPERDQTRKKDYKQKGQQRNIQKRE